MRLLGGAALPVLRKAPQRFIDVVLARRQADRRQWLECCCLRRERCLCRLIGRVAVCILQGGQNVRAICALPALTDAITTHLGDGTVSKVALDTYHREIERYGGGHGVTGAGQCYQCGHGDMYAA